MVDEELVNFIKEARKRGFSNEDIINPLLGKGWKRIEIEAAFNSLKKKRGKQILGIKRRIYIDLDKEIIKKLETRARKNMFTLEEQIYDILRRSTISSKKSIYGNEKIDDLLVSLFSRRKRGIK